MAFRNGVRGAEALLDGLDEHLAHWLARQAFARPSAPRYDLPVTAVFGERRGHGLAGIALDLEAV